VLESDSVGLELYGLQSERDSKPYVRMVMADSGSATCATFSGGGLLSSRAQPNVAMANKNATGIRVPGRSRIGKLGGFLLRSRLDPIEPPELFFANQPGKFLVRMVTLSTSARPESQLSCPRHFFQKRALTDLLPAPLSPSRTPSSIVIWTTRCVS
jgi:hypothetical protein